MLKSRRSAVAFAAAFLAAHGAFAFEGPYVAGRTFHWERENHQATLTEYGRSTEGELAERGARACRSGAG